MSRFLSQRLRCLTPYQPGEQPPGDGYIKLNTNESPFPPSPKAVRAAALAAEKLELYPDPECAELTRKTAEMCGVGSDCVLMTNGSDEILDFAFKAFCSDSVPAVFPDITYGFYPVFAGLNGVPFREIPLREDFTLAPEDYFGCGGTVFIANPNAPTGLALSAESVEAIVANNPDNVVVIDEAYVDFGARSCVPLIRRYPNLLVTQTFSKSRSMAGARLGFGAACPELINDLKTVKYSTNPYNINRMTMAAGIGVLEDGEYTRLNCRKIADTRRAVSEQLKGMGFELTDSMTNFIFARHPKIGGGELCLELRKRRILVRHFSLPRIEDYDRITVGSEEQMAALVGAIREILESI